MFKNFYLKIPRRARLLIIFLILILLGYFVARFLVIDATNVPEEFLKARAAASLVANDIVSFSNTSANNLKEISELDKNREHEKALILITQELERNKEARNKALELSVQLEIMAKNVAQISPSSASQLAIQAISSETALINRLINYNEYLLNLLEILQKKFLGLQDGSGKIPELIDKVNEEVRMINELDQKFNTIMGEIGSWFF